MMRILAGRIRVLWQQWTNSHGLQKSCGEKGQHGHSLSEREGKRARESLTPAWTGCYCFSEHITSRLVLTYYAQVHCR